MKNVLLIINHNAFARQMARWACLINKSHSWKPIIYITNDNFAIHLDDPQSEGIKITPCPSVIHANTPSANGSTPPPVSNIQCCISNKLKDSPKLLSVARFYYGVFAKFYYSHIVRIYHSSIITLPFRTIRTIIKIKSRKSSIQNIIRENNIDSILIAESGSGDESGPGDGGSVFVRIANDESIPIFTIPIFKWSARAHAEIYLTSKNRQVKGLSNRLIEFFFPNWVYCHKGVKMIRVFPDLLLALEFLRMSPPNPWMMINNNEVAIALDSIITYDFYSQEGVEKDKMVVVGAPEHDIMYNVQQDAKRLKSELCQRLNISADLPIILTPLPQPHYIEGRPECDFQIYEEMVEFWLKSLGSIKGYNVIVSLHPSHTILTDKSNYWNYIEQWGVKICREDIASLIPLCDLFVAAGSSTIPWALACSKPVINYDIYRYFNSGYQPFPGIITIQEQHEFLEVLRKMTSSQDYYKKIADKHMLCAKKWGTVDGMATVRLLDLFDKYTDIYPQGNLK